MYLRQGEWCKCECSCDTSRGKLEDGVSVYECEHAGQGQWQGTGKAFAKLGRAFTGQRRKYLAGRETTWYLVTGERVGSGADGEPLLKKVTPHKIVVWDGERFFCEKAEVQNIEHNYHPRFPNCTCDSIVDLFAQK